MPFSQLVLKLKDIHTDTVCSDVPKLIYLDYHEVRSDLYKVKKT